MHSTSVYDLEHLVKERTGEKALATDRREKELSLKRTKTSKTKTVSR